MFRVVKGRVMRHFEIGPAKLTKDWSSLGAPHPSSVAQVHIQAPASDHFGNLSVYRLLSGRMPAAPAIRPAPSQASH